MPRGRNMLVVLVFRLAGQADTRALRQLLYLWVLQKAKQEKSSLSMEHILQQQLHLQQTLWCWKATHKHTHTRKSVQFLETNTISENLDTSEILHTNKHTNIYKYIIFRRQGYQRKSWHLWNSQKTPTDFRFHPVTVKVTFRWKRETSKSWVLLLIQHKANIVSHQHFLSCSIKFLSRCPKYKLNIPCLFSPSVML